MITPIAKNYKGLISITGPIKSGKSKLAEFLITEHDPVTYIATSKPRPIDSDWQDRIDIHRQRRPDSWKLIEHPKDISNEIESTFTGREGLISGRQLSIQKISAKKLNRLKGKSQY